MTPFMLQNSVWLGLKGKAEDMDCKALTGHNTEFVSLGMIISLQSFCRLNQNYSKLRIIDVTLT